MAGDKLSEIVRRFRHFIAQQGWSISSEKAIAYGYQFTVTDGQSSVPVALYATGKTLVQGKASALQTALKVWDQPGQTQGTLNSIVAPDAQTGTLTPSSIKSSPLPQATGLARIGSDESGKGDFYGPLVIAAVYVDQQSEPQLLQLGVKDSKKLTDKNMAVMAQEIKRLCPYHILTYLPEAYNQLYQQLSNLNILLARAHAEVLTSVANQTAARHAIVDQFGDEALVRQALYQTGSTLSLEQRHRAEEDTAVAAASILARAEFVHQLTQLSESIDINLPKGASNPQIVAIGRQLVAQQGETALRRIAKLHFKTTATILQPQP
ncbi:ribonuclease HIII [Dictyobacter kobayashii]|uniref:Ribonuclease n=1 Tax=Dictyobacter kobayashii TaxID=2014872 RepID=A0A402AD93_9CHLR|nr:ribonuclease HIII [Dictyobacter kobayashii]GCE17064.1 ribonuclease HIII [Dictyobacter kobayashii]